MRILFLIVLTITCTCGQSQSNYTKEQWQAAPALHTIEKKYSDAAAVYVLDKKVSEFVIEKDGFFVYRTLHRIVHINNDQGIESFNKVYLPFGDGVEMLDVKARTVLPDGKVIELNKANIKDITDDEGNSYKIFAIDGLTKNCEVEYYYTLKKVPSYFGTDFISSKIPAMQSRWELIAPATLVFETKAFNNLPAIKDSSSADKRYLWLDARNIDEADEEKYAMYDADLKRVEYKLAYNKAKNATERLFTWNELAKKAYAMYAEVSEKEEKKIKEVLAGMILLKSSTPEKIAVIESYIKKNFVIRKDISSEDANDLTKVLKAKVISERATIKLFLAFYNAAGVSNQLVFCGSRSDYGLDRSFENWNNASNNVIYFPDQKKFLAPTEVEFRCPWIPPTWAGTLGVFCVPTTIGSFTTALSEVKQIPFEEYEYNFSNINVKASFEKEEAMLLQVQQAYGGYSAVNYRAAFSFAPQDQQDKFLKELIKFGTNSENMLSHNFENKDLEQSDPYKPFIINASVRSTQLFDKAGAKYLVKVGELIGQQAEMYETKQRSNNITLYYPHALVRDIELTIPDGYKVANLDDININQVYKDGDVITMGFVSRYELSGNTLKIKIEENYRNVTYPIEQYEVFKKVINAAADFNKVVLILDKKNS
jgi:hypothetical protein